MCAVPEISGVGLFEDLLLADGRARDAQQSWLRLIDFGDATRRARFLFWVDGVTT